MVLTKKANLRAFYFIILFFFVQGTELHGQDRGDSLITLLEEQTFEGDSGKVKLLNKIGKSLYSQYPDSAAVYLKKANDLAKGIGYKEGLANALNLLGIVYYVKSEYKEASGYWEELLELRRREEDLENMASVQNNLGLLYSKVGSYKRSLKAHQEALRIRDSIGLKKRIAQSMNNLGMIHFHLKNMDRSERYYRNALALYQEERMKEKYGRVYNNLSLIYRERSAYEKALELGRKALEAERNKGTPRHLANALLSVGLAFQELGEADSAIHYYKKAKIAYQSVGNQGGVAQAISNIGGVEFTKGNFEHALELSMKGFRKADSVGALSKKQETAYTIARASAEMGDSGTAFRYQRIHDELSDSLLNEEKSKQLAGLEVKYESEKRKRELEREKARRRKTELKWQRGLFITGGGGGLLLLVIVFLILRYRQKKLANQWLEEQKEALRKEKETKEVLLKEVNHRVKNNLQLITSLLSLQGKRIEDEELRGLHLDSQNRIHSMGLLHEKIHRTEKWDGEDLEQFLEELAERLKETFGMGQELVTDFEVDASELDGENITPLALILNELLSNAMKYAFKGRDEGRIEVEIVPEGDHYRLEVRDDGDGIENVEGNEEGLGLEIVRSLAGQLGGNLEILEREKGTNFRIRFPKRV